MMQNERNNSFVDHGVILSVIIPVFNAVSFLEQALKSVIDQKSEDIEIIVVDGGSTDGSLTVLNKYAEYVDRWISEADEGQSDAIDKGIKMALGQWVTWLNADDYYLDGAFVDFKNVILKHPEICWVVGNTVRVNEENLIIQCRQTEKWSKVLPYFGHLNAGGPSSFFKKMCISALGD